MTSEADKIHVKTQNVVFEQSRWALCLNLLIKLLGFALGLAAVILAGAKLQH
jgi:hypothetical protein